MPTSKYFKECPEFPSDISIAGIPTISYLDLLGNSAEESKNLYEACREQWFFFLDFHNSKEGKRILKDAEIMYDPAGVLKIDDGKMDSMELYTISRDEVLGANSTRRDPKEFQRHREDCKQFFLCSHAVLSEVMTHLDKQLGLAPGTLSALSSLEKPSATSLCLLMARSQSIDDKIISLGGHTDIGTITILFHVVGDFQVHPAGSTFIVPVMAEFAIDEMAALSVQENIQ
ncbi:hypothetical protein ABEW05_001698 [Botrytis cinerea]